MNKEDKIVLLGSPLAKTALMRNLNGTTSNLMLVHLNGVLQLLKAIFENDHDKYFRE